ncbi:hypothetical protein OU995_03775 [Roseateles sp. SL47]|uniref:hypothetical protein n=1 Tax=Roseateles sp. SL47 TaxID=2995138 RepID=UPI0022718AFF|nr:hypothetical protein [Roseateles sp. SL47]WAC73865.1 hypothetical protein OU995_03775 [Roseateles sp. SL47]
MSPKDLPHQEADPTLENQARAGADLIRELTPKEVLCISGGPQIINDGLYPPTLDISGD